MPDEVHCESREIPESEIINKLVSVPYYTGVMDTDMKIVPLWDIGIKKVHLHIFLKGAQKYYDMTKERGHLHIPINIPNVYANVAEEVIRAKYLNDLERTYPINCVTHNCSLEEVVAMHHDAESNK